MFDFREIEANESFTKKNATLSREMRYADLRRRPVKIDDITPKVSKST